MSPYRTRAQRRIYARERYLGWKRSLRGVSGGLTCRIKVGSISTCPEARAVARKVTALLLLVPAAEGVRLARQQTRGHRLSQTARQVLSRVTLGRELRAEGLVVQKQAFQAEETGGVVRRGPDRGTGRDGGGQEGLGEK